MKIFLSIIFSVGLLLVAHPQIATANLLEFTSQCTTKATDYRGRRNSCESSTQKFTAPSGWVLNQMSLEKVFLAKNGSEYSCHHSWADWTEVIPGTGIIQPRTLIMRANARSDRPASRRALRRVSADFCL